jgi:hypothetical protein
MVKETKVLEQVSEAEQVRLSEKAELEKKVAMYEEEYKVTKKYYPEKAQAIADELNGLKRVLIQMK